MIAFVQPFGLASHSGGSRIVRAMLEGDHPPVLVIDTGLYPPPSKCKTEEVRLPLRPNFGRFERTRLHGALGMFDEAFSSRFENRLIKLLKERKVKAIHAIPHTYDVVPVSRIASKLGIPYFLSIHDDLEYTSHGHALRARMLRALGAAWRNAKGVYVISEEIGKEYSHRYGAREYHIVTDGLTTTAEGPRNRPDGNLRIYFMGMFHFTYAPNFRALLSALKIVREHHPLWNLSLTCRCGSISCPVNADDVPVKVLPFAPEKEIVRDMDSADLLYQPLPFQPFAANFGRFSMSTKLVSYLGSGLPILYHGPKEAAACKLLESRAAAVTCTSLDPASIAKELIEALSKREVTVNSALRLARDRFMLADQQARFWHPIVSSI